ncbi:MAG: head-tail connector protein [Treponema sp.]|jgi:hypothetical protein|nr:head-tail connector protein [Treponema sp.]
MRSESADEKEIITHLKRRFERLKEERDKRLPDWKDVQRYVAASTLNWDDPQDKTPQRPQRFTGRPTQFARTLRSGIIGYSISPNIVWLKLSFENLRHLEEYGVKDWLENVERVLYAEFRRSNLYQQAGLFIDSAANYGHGVMLIDEVLGENRLRFTAQKVQEVFLDIDEFDRPDTVFRRYTMTLRNAAEFFGEEKLSEIQREELKRDQVKNKEITILHTVYKRTETDSESRDAKNMPYASIYIDEGEDRILLESGYREFPFAVFVWEPVAGTPYGESPAIHALDDVRILNKMDESQLQMVQMAGDPAYNVPDTMRGSENVVPHGYNYYNKPNEIITPINSGLNFPITLEKYRDIEDRVKDWFHVDFFLMLQRQGPKNMTATEVMELQGEKASVLSDLVVNLNVSLEKIIQRSFNILWRQGKIPPPPSALDGTGAQLKVEFMGPLAQAQKKYHESGGIQQGLGLIGAVANIAPQALDTVDFDQTLKRGLEGLGFPQDAIREDADVEEMRIQRAQQEAQMQQQAMAMEQQKNLMGNMDKLNRPVQPGSPLDEINKQMAGGM